MNDRELIEQYLLGKLTAIQESDFEERCHNDLAFGKRFREEAILFKAVKDMEAREYLQKVDEVLGDVSSQSAKLKRVGFISIFVAAAAMILILIGLFFVLPNGADSSQLYSDYFEPYPMLISNRGPDQKAAQQLVNAYDQSDWQQVLELLPVETLTSSLNDLYRAIAHLGLEESEQAESILVKSLSNKVEAPLQNTIKWYLVQAHLQQAESSAAKILLEELSNGQISNGLRLKVDALRRDLK